MENSVGLVTFIFRAVWEGEGSRNVRPQKSRRTTRVSLGTLLTRMASSCARQHSTRGGFSMRGKLTMTTVNRLTALVELNGMGVQELDTTELTQVEGGMMYPIG